MKHPGWILHPIRTPPPEIHHEEPTQRPLNASGTEWYLLISYSHQNTNMSSEISWTMKPVESWCIRTMEKCSEATSPSYRSKSKKPNLGSSKARAPNPTRLTSQTPGKSPQRIRNRRVALAIADIRKVGRGLQEVN